MLPHQMYAGNIRLECYVLETVCFFRWGYHQQNGHHHVDNLHLIFVYDDCCTWFKLHYSYCTDGNLARAFCFVVSVERSTWHERSQFKRCEHICTYLWCPIYGRMAYHHSLQRLFWIKGTHCECYFVHKCNKHLLKRMFWPVWTHFHWIRL